MCRCSALPRRPECRTAVSRTPGGPMSSGRGCAYGRTNTRWRSSGARRCCLARQRIGNDLDVVAIVILQVGGCATGIAGVTDVIIRRCDTRLTGTVRGATSCVTGVLPVSGSAYAVVNLAAASVATNIICIMRGKCLSLCFLVHTLLFGR